MLDSYSIHQKAADVLNKAATHDLEEIAKSLGVQVYWNGAFETLLGMYTVINKKKAIVLNNRLDEYMVRMVLAHELGHSVLHSQIAHNGMPLQEFQLFDMRNETEYEANAFASHLLIDTNTFVELAHEGQDIATIASTMGVNINLALIKLQELVNMGYDLRLPMDARGDFLKNIKAPKPLATT